MKEKLTKIYSPLPFIAIEHSKLGCTSQKLSTQISPHLCRLIIFLCLFEIINFLTFCFRKRSIESDIIWWWLEMTYWISAKVHFPLLSSCDQYSSEKWSFSYLLAIKMIFFACISTSKTFYSSSGGEGIWNYMDFPSKSLSVIKVLAIIPDRSIQNL